MAFNLKQYKQAELTVTEDRLRKDNIGPKASDKPKLTEEVLPHRTTEAQDKVTEKQMPERKSEKDERPYEKRLNEDDKYRDDSNIGLEMPPIQEVVAKLREERMKDWKPDIKPHWSTQNAKDQKAQLGALPKWPKIPQQPEPLSPDLKTTTADIDRVVNAVKTGQSLDYDTAMVAILQQAEKEQRELSGVERKAIADLKIARTQAFLKAS